jgi:hypothetical protein
VIARTFTRFGYYGSSLDEPGANHDLVFVQDRRLSGSDAVRGPIQLEPESGFLQLYPGRNGL